FRLGWLQEPAALLAVQPRGRRMGVDFTTGAARKLVDDLRRVRVPQPEGTVAERLGPDIEPVQLQVVCYRLWEKLPAAARQIGEADVEAVEDVDSALAGYYAEQVAKIAGAAGVSERSIRD